MSECHARRYGKGGKELRESSRSSIAVHTRSYLRYHIFDILGTAHPRQAARQRSLDLLATISVPAYTRADCAHYQLCILLPPSPYPQQWQFRPLPVTATDLDTPLYALHPPQANYNKHKQEHIYGFLGDFFHTAFK